MRSWVVTAVGVVLLAVAPVAFMLSRVGGFGLRDHLDLFGLTMGTPLTLVFPLIIVALTCIPLMTRLSHRSVANTRVRYSIRRFLLGHLIRITVIAFGAGLLFASTSFVFAFGLWPMWGDVGIDPAGYFLTPETAVLDSFSRFSYSQLLEAGTGAYGLLYSAWVGFASMTFAYLGFVSLALISNKFVALTIPFGVALVETVGAAVVGAPRFGIIYSVFPFGLQQAPILISAIPLLILAVIVLSLVIFVFVKAPHLRAFS